MTKTMMYYYTCSFKMSEIGSDKVKYVQYVIACVYLQMHVGYGTCTGTGWLYLALSVQGCL